jgi:hypothetical protein
VSDNGAASQELRLPQDGTGGSGHLEKCEEEEEERVGMKRDQAQITRDNRWWEGTGGISPMADFVLRNDGTRICGFGDSGSSGNDGHVRGSSGVPGL